MAQVIKRSWSKKSQISEHTDVLDIWDSGSHIFERWPDGTEYYWNVVSRNLTENGFTETLRQMPRWQMPGQILRREQIPLLQVSPSQFQMGAWNVEQELVHRAFDRLETSEGNMRQNKPSSEARPLQQAQPVSKKHYQKGSGRQQQEQKVQMS
jgi:hypothetical protein